VADDFVSLLGHQRESVALRDGSAKVVDQIRDDVPVVAERRQMHSPDTPSVALRSNRTPTNASVVNGSHGSPLTSTADTARPLVLRVTVPNSGPGDV
jgi:hypothetical protein